VSAVTDRQLALARSVLDRVAERRTDEAWLASAWADPTTRVLVVSHGKALVAGDAAPALVLISPAEAGSLAGADASAGAGESEGTREGERYLLGVAADGIVYVALAVPQLPDPAGGARPAGLREVGALVSDRDAGLLVHAVALEQWHRTHLRRCPACGAEHYPRTDPAVIVLITDPSGRCLLGRQPSWPPRRYSVFAGFVEPGESLEQAVVRELAEEVGVQVTDVRYVASQPWPFPSSLMLGFTARAQDSSLRLDGEEISDARWYSRDELRAVVDDGSVLLPSAVSIARRLIEDWYGEPLPEANRW
jgi:NAD+ diphosphatase